eukprot:5322920-Prymnesium_polylepis.1
MGSARLDLALAARVNPQRRHVLTRRLVLAVNVLFGVDAHPLLAQRVAAHQRVSPLDNLYARLL